MSILAGVLLNTSSKPNFGKAALNTSILVYEFVCLSSTYLLDFGGKRRSDGGAYGLQWLWIEEGIREAWCGEIRHYEKGVWVIVCMSGWVYSPRPKPELPLSWASYWNAFRILNGEDIFEYVVKINREVLLVQGMILIDKVYLHQV